MNEVKIHLNRIQKPPRTFVEGLVEDDGVRLRTFSLLPAHIRGSFSEAFQREGKIPFGQEIGAVKKYLFYAENFAIIEFQSTAGILLGYYVDITTPVRKVDGAYFLDDMIIDFWIYPDQTYQVLDEDEWQQAVTRREISVEEIRTVHRTIRRLKAEIKNRKFPQRYIAD